MAGEVRYQPIEEDYVRANRIWLGRRLTRPRALPLMALAAASGAWLEYDFGLLGGSPTSPIVAAFLIVALISVAKLAQIPLAARRARRLFHQQASLQRPHQAAWSAEGLGFTSEIGEVKQPWRDFHGWNDRSEMFLFYLNEQMFYFLPHRIFSADQMEDLRGVVRASGLRSV